MSHKKHSDLQVVVQEHEVAKLNIFYLKFLAWFSLAVSITAIGFCSYIMIAQYKLKKEQGQIAKFIQEAQEIFPLNKPEAIPLPDNLEVILQDLVAQNKAQQKAIKILESVVVSDLNPKVNFLLESGSKQQTIISEHASTKAPSLIFVVNALRIAETYLTELHNIKIANSMLTIAEQLLLDLNQATYIELQAAIEKDKQSLANIQLPDKSSILLALQELLTSVDQYPHKNTNISTAPAITSVVSEEQNIAQTATWEAALKNTFNELKSLIKVKRSDTTIGSLASISSLEERLQRDSLRFLLEQIRVVSLGEDNVHYQMLLLEVKNIFLEHFSREDALNQQAIIKIDTMREINIQPNIPIHINSLAKAEELLQPTVETRIQ